MHEAGDGKELEENLTLLAQEVSTPTHGRSTVQVLYATPGRARCIAVVRKSAWLLCLCRMHRQRASKAVRSWSPLTGKVLKVLVAQGAQVDKGEALLIIEAMKMENIVQAEGSGTVAALNVKVGDAVRSGDVLLSLAAVSTLLCRD